MLIYPDTYLVSYKPKPSPWDAALEAEQELSDEKRDEIIHEIYDRMQENENEQQ